MVKETLGSTRPHSSPLMKRLYQPAPRPTISGAMKSDTERSCVWCVWQKITITRINLNQAAEGHAAVPDAEQIERVIQEYREVIEQHIPNSAPRNTPSSLQTAGFQLRFWSSRCQDGWRDGLREPCKKMKPTRCTSDRTSEAKQVLMRK